MIFRYLKLLLVFFFLSSSLEAKTQFFTEGLNFYKNNKFEEAKFKFEQDLVLNPKNELSYLYLSKIFKNLKNKELEEQNLNTVILLNPRNEDAIYSLARLKLDSSDYKKSKALNNKLMSLCDKFCDQSQKLKIEIENLSKK